ncbi:hypothetical protein GCM10027160_38940 [Streptomyces calidiresistens]
MPPPGGGEGGREVPPRAAVGKAFARDRLGFHAAFVSPVSPAETTYVCLPCRRSWKRGWEASRNPEWRQCPHRADVMIHAGAALAVPRRADTEGRRVLTVLLNAGIRFHKSCCGGPGYRPRTMREVRGRLAYARASGEPVARAPIRPELPRPARRSPRRDRAPHGG